MGALPTLRSVSPDDAPRPDARRRRRATTAPEPRRRSRASVAVVGVTVVFAVLFAAAAVQIRLISGQRRLDRLEQQVSDAQVRQDSLRQKEANLRSPAQITQIATEQLGMVNAAPPVMVRPADPYIGSATPQTTPQTTSPAASLAASRSAPGDRVETAGAAD
jgi:cell division protein FtsL